MNSLVLELQSLAAAPDTDIASLLRKAMLVAGKLQLNEFRMWIDHELDGYKDDSPVPTYRMTRGTLHVVNPFHGLQPFIVPDREIADKLLLIEIRDPIGNLIHLLGESKSKTFQYPLPDDTVSFLMEAQGSLSPLPPVRLVSSGAIATVIEGIRTQVLDWAIKLEQEGILGEGMVFSMEEKQKASTSQTIHIQTFSGVLGDVTGSNVIKQSFSQRVHAGDMASLCEAIRKVGGSESDIAELTTAIAADPKPQSSTSLGPQTSNWIGRMVAKAASGGLAIGVEAAGNLLAKAVLMYYGIEG
jgi:hypothetical protein